MSDEASPLWTCADCSKRNWQHCHWCPHCGALKPPPKVKPKPNRPIMENS